MVSVLTERMVFPTEELTYTVQGFTRIDQLAFLRERSKYKGQIDKGLLMIRTLEAGVVEPRLSEADVTTLMRDHPEVALHLAVRIASLSRV